MKSLSILISLLVLCSLCSCRRIETNDKGTLSLQSEGILTAFGDTTDTDKTPETESPLDAETTGVTDLPCVIGFYDDLLDNGTYTRLEEWKALWIKGKDIAVFDIIPSSEKTLISRSYKKLWISESEKITKESLVQPYFELEYTLNDGSIKTFSISTYIDAEFVTDQGYLEVYLYDDIHQTDGEWYYHLTEETSNFDTVISSFKLTAGKNIDLVKNITITAYIENSAPCTITVFRDE